MSINRPKHWLLKNIPFFISAVALLALRTTHASRIDVTAVCIGLAALVSLIFPFDPGYLKAKSTRASLLAAAAVALTLGASFYEIMGKSPRVLELCTSLGISQKLLVIPVVLVGIVCSLYALAFATAYLLPRLRIGSNDLTDRPVGLGRELLVCFLTAAVVMTFFSKSSPLYPINDWVDANCYMTVGRAMLVGKLPYRDLFEHKGPLLYILHAFAAMVSTKSFLGVYFLEILACGCFLYLCRRVLTLYKPNSSLLWLPVIAAVVYSAPSFCHGDSAEEFCLPMVTYSLYVILRSLKTETPVSFREGVLIGITSGAVLWIKFSMLGIYIGLFLCFVWLRLSEKRGREIFSLVGSILCGIAAITIPIFLYFAAYHALDDLFTVYIYNNAFDYTLTGKTQSSNLLHNLYLGYASVNAQNFLPNVLGAIGVYTLAASHRKKEFSMALSMLLMLFILVYAGGQLYPYYCFILCAFAPLGIAGLEGTAAEIRERYFADGIRKRLAPVGVCLASLLMLAVCSDNTDLLGVPQSELPQYQFAQIINETEDATLLNYGFLDGGFYLATGITPTCKSFCKPTIQLSEIMDRQNQFVNEGLVDYVVTRDRPLESERYTCIAETSYPYEGEMLTYWLYQKVK